jgi:glycosyltransferase involved in cell wall biosynthesis
MFSLHGKKVLIAHPFLNFYGGAEYMLKVVASEIAPHADIFVFSYTKKIIEKLGIDQKRLIVPVGNILSPIYQQATPLYPAIIDTVEFNNYDYVLSFSYGYSHGIITNHHQKHVSYIQTPMRLLWLRESEFYWYNKVPLVKNIYQSILTWQRLWDKQAATRPDKLLANSQTVRDRINTFWGLDATVVHPPVDVAFYSQGFENAKKEEYFIMHSRLVRYKRVDLLIEAAKLVHKKLVIVGDGPDYKRLKAIKGKSTDIEFVGNVGEVEKRTLLQNAKGFVYASEEDFGIAPVEAMAAGLPIYALSAGGVKETVTSNEGIFFSQQEALCIADGWEKFESFTGQINPENQVRRASLFSQEKFIEGYLKNLENLVD